jgi:type II secretory pathway pseudopilin PulG
LKPHGTSLIEIMTVFSVIAIISVYAIPQLLNSSQNNQRAAVSKRDIAALSQITFEGFSNQSTNIGQDILDKLGCVKICTNAYGQGCVTWDTDWAPATYYTNIHACVTTEGSVIIPHATYLNGGGTSQVIMYDWNGAAGPNIWGQDYTHFYATLGPGNASFWGGCKAGKLCGGQGAPGQFWQSIFN